MKMSDSPLRKGAKALGPWGLSCWHLAGLAHGTTPLAFRFFLHFLRGIFVGAFAKRGPIKNPEDRGSLFISITLK